MFGFLSMASDYESRKVDRYDGPSGFVSTALVTDSRDPYETGIQYDVWGDSVVIVQTYENVDLARAGHQRYVELMVTGALPKEKPRDAGTNILNDMAIMLESKMQEEDDNN